MKKVLLLLLNVVLLATLPTACLRANPPANDPPVITVTGNTSICYGSSTTLTANGALTYTWTTALPLDGVSSAAMAVGLHKLKTSYSGFALQLRRSSDNATLDIGFSGNDLDLAAINTFLNGANGFCAILYDQSGNGNNLVQPIGSSQPSFVANGQNGKPVLHCNAGQYMRNTTNFTTPYSVVYAARQTGGTRQRVLSSVNNNWLLGWWGGFKDQAYFEGWVNNPETSSTIADNIPVVYSCTGDVNSSSFYKNGSALVSNSTAGLTGPDGIQMNGSGTFGELSDCDFMDIMLFNSALPGTDRQLVENSIAAYYNIGNSGSQLSVSPLTTTTYTVTGTNSNGETASATVTVNVAPQHSISPAGPLMICTGSSVTLTASAGSSWLWSTGETSQSIVVDTAGAFSVTVDNCPSSNTVHTYVSSVTPATTLLCNGNTTLTAVGPSPDNQFTWTGANYNYNTTQEMAIPESNNVTALSFGNTVAYCSTLYGYTGEFKIDLYNPDPGTWVNIFDTAAASNQSISFANMLIRFPVIQHVTRIRFTCNSFYYVFNGFSNMPFALTTNISPFSYLWNTGQTTQQILVTSAGTYSVSIAGCATVSATVLAPPGDPDVFGNNVWNVYAWNTGGEADTIHAWHDNYAGFYVEDSISFDTRTRWNSLGTPSDASGYTGCTVANDNHSYSAKRHGFPCSMYQIDIPVHDDASQLFINGVMVWEHIGCCDTHENVWRGVLNSTSEVEYRTTEGGGGSLEAISFIPFIDYTCPLNNEVTVQVPAGQCSGTVPALDPPVATSPCSAITITNDHPSTTYSVGTTFVTWTISDADGHIAYCVSTVHVLEPTPPVINCPAPVTVNNTPGLCGAIVNIAPTATDNCPNTAVGNKTFNATHAVQLFRVPPGITTIRINAIGAAGGAAPNAVPGRGASISGFFQVTPGDTLYMMIGGQGQTSFGANGGGGGGGTFVSKDPSFANGLLIAAGGGGGAGEGGSSDASITTGANNGGNGGVNGGGIGGTSGGGGGYSAGSAGAGWLTDGSYGDCNYGGSAPRNSGSGGDGAACGAVNGGYGGGGGSYYGAGGGGGYSGGGGGDYNPDFTNGMYGGGGGSYNAGASPVNTSGIGTGDGKVIISYTMSFPIIALTAGIPSGDVFPIGTTLDTWTVTDASGNTAICSASVSVLDKEAPVFNCPSNITTNVDAGQCTAVVNFSTPTISENCCPVLSNSLYTNIGTFGSHVYYLSNGFTDWNTAHVQAVAAGGNLVSINSAAENAFLVTALNGTRVWIGGFQNHQSPTYSEPAGGWEWVDGTPFTYTNWNAGEPNNSGGEDYAEFFGLWNDLNPGNGQQYVVEVNCFGSLTQIAGPVSGTAFPIGTTTITYKATDAAGNSSTCSFNVIVTDNANPGITVPAISGNGTICIGIPSQLSDATSGGIWTSVNPTIATVDNTGLVTGVAPGDATIKYTVNINGCDRVVYKQVTVYSVPVLTNAVITGVTNVCPYIGTGIPLTYTITNAVSATGYTWTVPTTATILSGQGTASITVTINAGFVATPNKQIRVKANSVCGTSAEKIYYLLAQLPNTPKPIDGSTDICSVIGTSTAVSYKIPIVPGASSYIWTIPQNTTATHPNGPGAFDTVINVVYTSTFAGGNITVQTANDCGTSGARGLAINRVAASTPGLIHGSTNACAYMLPNGSIATYSIVPVNGAASYTWTTPTGSVVTHPYTGVYDTVINIRFPAGFTSGNITVTATNGCGTSTARSLAITRLNPATPSVIDVIQTQACPGRMYSYTLSSMPANATSVQWAVPASAISFTGQGTTSITVNYPDAAVLGTVTATAINNCGTSTVRSTAVKLPACAPTFTRGNNENKASIKETAIEKVSIENKIIVSPNPSTSSFRLTVYSLSKQPIQVRLLDASGRRMKNMNLQSNQTIDFGSDLKAGIYLLEIEQDGERRTERVVKL